MSRQPCRTLGIPIKFELPRWCLPGTAIRRKQPHCQSRTSLAQPHDRTRPGGQIERLAGINSLTIQNQLIHPGGEEDVARQIGEVPCQQRRG